jgi:4-amino-4-deoxy-L-arabinose transferase-like glycosyltransferase
MKKLLPKIGAAILVLTVLYSTYIVGDNKIGGNNLVILAAGVAVGLGLVILPSLLEKDE